MIANCDRKEAAIIHTSQALHAETKTFCRSFKLTPRETDVVDVLVNGTVRIKDVADHLRLSPNTVNNHVNSILLKTKTRSKTELLSILLNRMAEELLQCRLMAKTPRLVILSDRSNSELQVLVSGLVERHCSVSRAVSASEPAHFILADLATFEERRKTHPEQFAHGRLILLEALESETNYAEARCTAMAAGAIDLVVFPMTSTSQLDVGSLDFPFSRLHRAIFGHYAESDTDRYYFVSSDMPKRLRQAQRRLLHATHDWGSGGLFLNSEDLATAFAEPLLVDDWVEFTVQASVDSEVKVHGDVVWVRDQALDNRRPGAGIRVWPSSDRVRTLFNLQNLSYVPAGVTTASC